jgi:hypothetical protein
MVAIPYSQSQRDNHAKIPTLSRSPRRMTITVPYALYSELLSRSDQQGRSFRNLAAFLLEAAIQGPE